MVFQIETEHNSNFGVQIETQVSFQLQMSSPGQASVKRVN